MARVSEVFTSGTSAILAASGFDTTQRLAEEIERRPGGVSHLVMKMPKVSRREVERVLCWDDDPLEC